MKLKDILAVVVIVAALTLVTSCKNKRQPPPVDATGYTTGK